MREFSLRAIAWCFFGVIAFGPGFVRAAEAPPNFLFILVDDLGWKDLACYGSTFYETPNCDRLAREGVRFTQAYASCQVCSPTRLSIQTGKYPARLNATDWFGAPGPEESAKRKRFKTLDLLPAAYIDRMPLEETTIAEALQQAGYATFFAGKWHLGGDGFGPQEQGYEINRGGGHKGSPYGGSYFAPYQNPTLEDGPEGEHLPARLGEETARFIRLADGPFYAMLSFYSVHTPLQTTDELREKYRAKADELTVVGPRFADRDQRSVRQVQDHAVYGGMVEAMDSAVGRVLDTLDELGLAENTVVFFTSDNGGLSTAEGSPTSNLPLRAGKGWGYEGGVRVCTMARWPGVAEPGTVADEVVTSTDFYPTMLEIAGLDPRPGEDADGKSFAPLLRGEPFDRGPVFWHYPHYGNQGGSPCGAVRDGAWKLIEWYTDNRVALYNLDDDPGEHANLAGAEPARVEHMKKLLDDWRRDVDAQMPTPNPAAVPGQRHIGDPVY